MRPAFSEAERADVRRQLAAYRHKEGFKSALALLQHIEATLGKELGCDDRRLRRFLNDTHRTADSVVELLIRFLNIALAPYARLAEETARYFSRTEGRDIREHDVDKLRQTIAGTYHVYLKGRGRNSTLPNDDEWVPGTTLPPFEIPYGVLKLDPLPDAPYLSAYEEVGNPDGNPAASETSVFGDAVARFLGCAVSQKMGSSYVIVLRRMQEFSLPKIYLVGEKYPESRTNTVLTGAMIERNRNELSDIHGAAATVKLVKQPD
ncbi:hypothetical protein C2I36_12940 [Rhodobacteraceae bacterium WD3A24]|nr:hypothetical protein C2I36_12940 [Rhodobacteraceae bacterium WD3A24]